ncbi:MAG: hypothetical protein QOJ84_4254 [Bradyrhizobium sp.]|jgi:hypothetical protein|nr:hypothetical protein [Bradyrhizobium sp.]
MSTRASRKSKPAKKSKPTKKSRPTKAKRNLRKGKSAAASGTTLIGAAAAPGVLLVNMIPNSLSFEEEQDSEPMIAVNPNNPDHIAGSAFTPDPMRSGQAPYFVSTDGGKTWALNTVVPGGSRTSDIAIAFSGTNDRFYVGILRPDSPTRDTRMSILRTDSFDNPATLQVLDDRRKPDQPFTQAITMASGPDKGKERLYVGSNDFAASPQSATLDIGLDVGAAAPSFKRVRIEHRTTAGQNGPQIRPALHPDGTVYAAFLGWRSQTGDFETGTLQITADVVVVRDDLGGTGATPCEDLKDPTDGQVGVQVARGVKFAFDSDGLAKNGQQRLGGTLAIAVDPRPGQSDTVYVAWGSDEPATGFTIHVRRSQNRGVTWSPGDLLTVPRGTNAALAINSDGVVGLLYQQLTGVGSTKRWETHLRRTPNGTVWSDVLLATTLANHPVIKFNPYLGDYDHVVAVGKIFYGIFSASNLPDRANFPNGVVYQRNADFTTMTLLNLNGVTTVKPSIDPFFFKVSA